MTRSYDISPRAADLGDGYNLRLYEDGEPAGGGVFPLPEVDAGTVMAWWHSLPDAGRAHWVKMASSDIPADVFRAMMLQVAHDDAMGEGEAWVGESH